MSNICINTSRELEFILFCIDFVARKLNLPPKIIYQKLAESGLLQDYLIENYEILHTQGKEYLVDEIIKLMLEKNLL